MITVTLAQLARIQRIASTYAPDVHDPAALEVLLMLHEVYDILGLSETGKRFFFGRRVLGKILDWGKLPLGERMREEAEAHTPHRVWVWAPGMAGPVVAQATGEGQFALPQVVGMTPAEEAALVKGLRLEQAEPAQEMTP